MVAINKALLDAIKQEKVVTDPTPSVPGNEHCVRHACKRVRMEMQAQIDAARRDAEWQPIDSAPKDGSHIWLGATGNMRIAFWHYPADGWIDHSLAENGSQRTVHFTPTHWMPLPKPPTVRLVRVVGDGNG